MSVIAYHLIWTNYGTWLSNDPRGSGSQMVYTPALAELAEPHFGRRKSQPPGKAIREFYREAEPLLQYSVIRFDYAQIGEIATAFAATIEKHRYTCYACAIMPDHIHLVMRKHKHLAEAMIEHFQSESRLRFSLKPEVPLNHPVWTNGGRKIFLDTPAAVRQRIRYVEKNPEEANLPPQFWAFVKPYDNWPFHNRQS